MIKKIIDIISYITILLTLGVLIYMIYLIFEPFTPPTLGEGDISILNEDKIIKEGETIHTKLDYCIYKKVPSTTTRRFENVDDQRVFFLSTTESAGTKEGCGSVESNTFVIPSSIPPGKYRMILTSSFRVNSFKTIVVNYQTEIFEVIK